MNGWRQALRRIGGPDAVTWPAFWATFVANLIGQFSTGGNVAAPTWVRLLAVLVGQLAMFAPLVLLRATVLRDPRRPHPWVVLIAFAVVPFIRTAALVWVLVTIGGVTDPQWVQRAFGSFANLFLVLLISALVVSALREHARTLTELTTVRGDLERTREQVQGQVETRNEEALARVRSTLEREIASLESGPEAVGSLQRLATDVVRPMSHELAQSVPDWRPERSAIRTRVARADVVRGLGQRGPFLPLATAAIMTVILIAPAQTFLVSARLEVLAASSIGVGVMLWLANRVLDRVLPARTAARSLAWVLATALIAGLIPSGLAGLAVAGSAGTGAGVRLAIGGTVFVAGVALTAATIRAVLAQQRQTEAELRESTDQLRASLARLHQVEWFQRKALSRALHGPVQSAATAAALRLDGAMRSGGVDPQLIDEVRASLMQEIDVLEGAAQNPLPVNRLADRLRGTWAGVCAVQVDIDDASRAMLEEDPVLRSTAHEIMTEAVSNAVRHGRAQEVGIRVSMASDDPGVLTVIVDNDGRGEVGASTGLGTQILDQCALGWSLEPLQEGTRMRARLPAAQAL